eukprot:4846976-Pyramimonas_sp.AAC.1
MRVLRHVAEQTLGQCRAAVVHEKKKATIAGSSTISSSLIPVRPCLITSRFVLSAVGLSV